MKTQAGVKSVAVGGLPQNGPMQSVSGTRGASVLPWSYISATATQLLGPFANFNSSQSHKVLHALGITQNDLNALPPSINTIKYSLRSGRFNMLDTIRYGSETPLQFAYEAADCRLFFTPAMITDITVLWKAAASLLSGSDSAYDICVQGSTGQPSAAPNYTSVEGPVGY